MKKQNKSSILKTLSSSFTFLSNIKEPFKIIKVRKLKEMVRFKTAILAIRTNLWCKSLWTGLSYWWDSPSDSSTASLWSSWFAPSRNPCWNYCSRWRLFWIEILKNWKIIHHYSVHSEYFSLKHHAIFGRKRMVFEFFEFWLLKLLEGAAFEQGKPIKAKPLPKSVDLKNALALIRRWNFLFVHQFVNKFEF